MDGARDANEEILAKSANHRDWTGRKPAARQGEVVMTGDEKEIRIDFPTLLAVSTLAWALVDSLHEIVGHAGAAVWLGLPVRAVSTTTAFIDVDWSRVIESRGYLPIRLVVAAGTVLNLVSGARASGAIPKPDSEATLRAPGLAGHPAGIQ